MPTKICPICNNIFHIKPSRVEKRRVCSRKCLGILYQTERQGEANPRWKGGRYKSDGRTFIRFESHPYANCKGYILESRLVMEKFIGRYLLPTEHIHHINQQKDDNRIENMQIISNSEHTSIHMCLRWTDEKRKEQSTAMTGKKLPAYWGENIKRGLMGKPKSDLHKQHLKEAWGKRRIEGR